MKILPITILITISLFLCGCEQHKDNSLSKALIGTWHAVETTPDGLSIERNVTYSQSGTMRMSGSIKFRGKTRAISGSGTWYVKEGNLHYTVQTSNLKKLIPDGFTSADKIINITDDIYTYVDGQRAKTVMETRVR